MVEALPPAAPSAEVTELESRLALHSIYFQTARPTEKNPGGGLVESQQDVLSALAAGFTRYLTFRPEAKLILGGHADLRGSSAYNQALTERRVERAKDFLVEHGVPPGSIEVQSFGKEDNLTASQVKEQIAENPDLTEDDRQKMQSNLRVIVLANNRRVDISLSTTGQQSVRRYPFNAKDALRTHQHPGGAESTQAGIMGCGQARVGPDALVRAGERGSARLVGFRNKYCGGASLRRAGGAPAPTRFVVLALQRSESPRLIVFRP